jgi:glycosyltransferase involved in cell wall biosynthesis
LKLAIDCRLRFGVETLLKNIVPLVAKAVDRVVLIGDEARLRSWQVGHSNVRVVPFDSPVYGVTEQVTFPYRELRDCDLLHVPNYNVPLMWDRPLVTTVNDLAHLSDAMAVSWPKRRYAASMIRLAVRRARHVLTLSEFSREELLRLSPAAAGKVTVAHCGIDPKRFRPPAPEARPEVEQLLGSDAPFILVSGRLRAHKNVNALLSAFQRLKDAHGIPHQLVVVGETAESARSSRIVPILPHLAPAIRFMGYVPEETLVQLYGACSVFVFPSLYEGFGLPPLEAMACGAPVVCSNRASLPEIVGDAALMVDAADVDALADAVLRVASDPRLREDLRLRGRERAAMFTWEATAAKYLHVYANCLSRN